jgi:ribosome-associated protein
MGTTETRKMVLAAAAVCDDKKAENTRVLELDPADSGFTDFFLITSGTNTRQTVAIADDIELKMKREFGTYANSVEGRRTGEWILMDYVDFVVHIFVEEKRAFYDIERLRKSARSIDLTQLKVALAEKTAAVRRTHPRPGDAAPVAEPELAAAKAAAGNKAVGKKAMGKKTAARKSAVKKASTRGGLKKATPAKKSATRIAAAADAAPKRASAAGAAASKSATKAAAKKASAAKKTRAASKTSKAKSGRASTGKQS